MKQKKNSLDRETWKKIGKGCLYAISGCIGASLPLIIPILPDWLAPAFAWLLPVAVTSVKEYVKGETKK